MHATIDILEALHLSQHESSEIPIFHVNIPTRTTCHTTNMSLSFGLKDYCTSHFEYKELTKIHGKPDIDTLVIIFKQLKRNAQRVPTSLGGGLLGYLALVLDTTTYDAIPNSAPFVRPILPGTFIPSNARLTAAEIVKEKAVHTELICIYNECLAVELALRNQLINAIPTVYLEPLRDADTNMINDTISDMISFLQKELL